MMKNVFRLSVCVLGLTLLASPAFAQALPWEGKGYVSINYGFQIASSDPVTSTQTFTIYDETGKVTTVQDIGRQNPFLDVGGGIRLFGNFGIGLAYTYLATKGDAVVQAEVPHPLVYDQPRKATTTAGGLEHVEQGYHIQALWMLPLSDRLDVILSGGPTVYMLKQGTVLTPTITEVGPPYTSVNMTTNVANTTATRVGFNAGADLTIRLTNSIGVGATARYTWAKFDLEPEGGGPMDVTAGGFQLAGGLRVRF
jgi:opacity protein-like surface antigen